MIRKRRPVSQAGTFNGIGGKVEQGESPADAMVRECFEESGIETLPLQWQHNVTLYGADHTCYFYDLFVGCCAASVIWDWVVLRTTQSL